MLVQLVLISFLYTQLTQFSHNQLLSVTVTSHCAVYYPSRLKYKHVARVPKAPRGWIEATSTKPVLGRQFKKKQHLFSALSCTVHTKSSTVLFGTLGKRLRMPYLCINSLEPLIVCIMRSNEYFMATHPLKGSNHALSLLFNLQASRSITRSMLS